ncbi:MAG: PfkB family carbohydrate kinase, partial [Pseudomonadota bacterium]
VTRGGAGATWHDTDGLREIEAFAVDPVDTTGAGDCFLGTLLAGLDLGLDVSAALRRASAAAAIAVTRPGASAAIPTAVEVDTFLSETAS